MSISRISVIFSWIQCESTIAHDSSDDDGRYIDVFELQLTDDESLEVEYINRTDWDGMNDPCPECGGTEFDHMQYEGGHYGQYQDTVIEQTDYWYQHGCLYTACKAATKSCTRTRPTMCSKPSKPAN